MIGRECSKYLLNEMPILPSTTYMFIYSKYNSHPEIGKEITIVLRTKGFMLKAEKYYIHYKHT